MARGRPKARLLLSSRERETLERLVRRSTTPQALALRARIVLTCANGGENQEVAQDLGVTPQTVSKWRRRFVDGRVEALSDRPRPGAPRRVSDADVERMIAKTLEEVPGGAAHWSTRAMARATGMSQTTVSRTWRAFGLQPHRAETLKLLKARRSLEGRCELVGLYMSPTYRAIVFGVEEKSQVAAAPGARSTLGLAPGQTERATHARNRVAHASLFSALDARTGKVAGQGRRRSAALRAFLGQIDREAPGHLEVHLVLDKKATQTAEIQRWLGRRPRFHLHFTPDGRSWLSLVDRWFTELREGRMQLAGQRSAVELESAISEFLESHSQAAQPFIWTRTTD